MWLLDDRIKTSGSAFYYDRYQKRNGQWLIKESRYHRLFEINENTEALPLSAHYLPNMASRDLKNKVEPKFFLLTQSIFSNDESS